MNPILPLSCALAFAAASSAQISVSMSVPAPIDVTCTEGAVTDTDTQPAGPSNYFERFAATPNLFAALGVFAFSSDLSAGFGLNMNLSRSSAAAPGAVAAIGPASLVVDVTCPTTTAVRWQCAFENASSPGIAPPQIEVDIGDDGIVDYIDGQLVSLAQPQFVGVQPVPVRITFSATTSSFPQPAGVHATSLAITVLPDARVTSTPVAIGCAGGGAAIEAVPTFLGEGVRIGATSFIQSMPLVAMVIGWGTQPVLLPSFGQAPCLFVPTPDIVVLQGFPVPAIDIALPPAVRPATFWVQGVVPDGQLLTTDCLRVDAL